MPNLKNIPTEDLEAEIKRREAEAERAERPKLLSNPDFSRVISACQSVIAAVECGAPTDDYSHHVFEAAMVACYGGSVWSWVNKKSR